MRLNFIVFALYEKRLNCVERVADDYYTDYTNRHENGKQLWLYRFCQHNDGR